MTPVARLPDGAAGAGSDPSPGRPPLEWSPLGHHAGVQLPVPPPRVRSPGGLGPAAAPSSPGRSATAPAASWVQAADATTAEKPRAWRPAAAPRRFAR